MRPRRSALFLPASNPRAVARVRTLPCDVVILDLEDAVAPEHKAAARAAAVATVGTMGERELIIRVNGLDTPWGADDLAAVAAAAPDAVLLPKVADAVPLAAARAALGPDGPPLWAMVETCAAVLGIASLAAEGRRHGLTALIAGTNDLAAEMRCTPGTDRAPLLPALTAIVLAARANDLIALDGVCNSLDDDDVIARECAQGVRWGFDGKSLIHPAQVAAANAAFSPDERAVTWARAVIAVFADPAAGAVRIDGRMVERLHLAEARRIIALAGAVGYVLPDASAPA